MHCGRSIVSLAMYEKGYLCQKDPSHPDPPRKSTQLACIYTEYVYVATLIQKGCPLQELIFITSYMNFILVEKK